MSTNAQLLRREEGGSIDGGRIDEEDFLAVLTDERCREILSALDGNSLTVAELDERLDIPQSTLYRKMDLLVETQLLDERTRIHSAGHHTTEYTRQLDAISLRVNLCAGVEIELDDGRTAATGGRPTAEVGAD